MSFRDSIIGLAAAGARVCAVYVANKRLFIDVSCFRGRLPIGSAGADTDPGTPTTSWSKNNPHNL